MKLKNAVISVCALVLLTGFSITGTSCGTNDKNNTDNKQEENKNVKDENSSDEIQGSDPKGNSENSPLNESSNTNDSDGKGVITPGRAN